MNTAITEGWKPYEDLISLRKLRAAISSSLALVPEEAAFVIPSFKIGKDGPYISSVFLVSALYLTEIRLGGDGVSVDFDVVLLRTIFNYRVKKELFVLSGDEKNSESKGVTYKSATIKFAHIGGNLETEMHYYGDAVDEWIKSVLIAIPISVIKHS